MVGIVIAFQSFNPMKGLFGSEWIGFGNFQFFFSGSDWLRIVFNTLFLNMLFLVTGAVVSVGIAVMLSELRKGAFLKLLQSIMILPYFLSWPIIGLFSVAFLSADTGVINHFLESVGREQISFYSNASVWPPALVIVRLWQGAGFGAIVYLAAIVGIDKELYEAAKIDGASQMQCIVRITLPLLRSTVIILALLSLGNIFIGDFGMIYTFVGDNPLLYATTDVIDTYVFRSLRTSGSLGMTAAVGLFQSVLGFLMVLVSNRLVKRYDPQSSIF